jgi:hypothetical protein
MIIMLGFYKKLPHLSTEEFRKHWNDHAKFIRDIPNYSDYVVKYVQHSLSPDPMSQTDLLYDGFSEAWFENEEKRAAFQALPYFQAAHDHEAQFLDLSANRWMVFDQPVVQIG